MFAKYWRLVAALVSLLAVLVVRHEAAQASRHRYRNQIAWLEFKRTYNKSYESSLLDALHRAIFVRRMDIFRTLNEQCKSEHKYKLARSLDEPRSTWNSYIEPTVRVYIRKFETKFNRNYADPNERQLRHQLLELFLDQRRLLRNCCKLSDAEFSRLEDETIDRTNEELEMMGKQWGHRMDSISHCQNTRGGPSQK